MCTSLGRGDSRLFVLEYIPILKKGTKQEQNSENENELQYVDCRRELGTASSAPQVFIKPWHDFHEIAGHVAIIQLLFENAVPAVLAGAGGAGQAEDESGARDTCRRTRLDGGCSDLLIAELMEGDGKSIHAFFK